MTDPDLDALLAVQSRSYRAAGEGLRRSWPEADALDWDGLRALIALTVEGPVAIHEGVAFAAVRERRDGEWPERHGHPPDWAAAMLELRPERVFSHGPRGA